MFTLFPASNSVVRYWILVVGIDMVIVVKDIFVLKSYGVIVKVVGG